eukprot:GHVU01202195.1.p1 GENE.GHVU01202195.1~~GHVU01202195.1.p1  ORF type:complete len:633 (+),score=14.33 GHVU01202195.1:122-2020(+)
MTDYGHNWGLLPPIGSELDERLRCCCCCDDHCRAPILQMFRSLCSALWVLLKGVKDSISVNRCWYFVVRSEIIRSRLVWSFLLNGVLFASMLLISTCLVIPVLRVISVWIIGKMAVGHWLVAVNEAWWYALSRYFVSYPLYVTGMGLNTFWCLDVADQAYMIVSQLAKKKIIEEGRRRQLLQSDFAADGASCSKSAATTGKRRRSAGAAGIGFGFDELARVPGGLSPIHSGGAQGLAMDAGTVSRTRNPAGRLEFLATAAEALGRVLLVCVWWAMSAILSNLPYVGVPIYWVNFSWMVSYYAFDYRWKHMQYSTHRRVFEIESKWIYLLGFGAPYCVVVYTCPPLLDWVMFAVVFPMSLLTAAMATPIAFSYEVKVRDSQRRSSSIRTASGSVMPLSRNMYGRGRGGRPPQQNQHREVTTAVPTNRPFANFHDFSPPPRAPDRFYDGGDGKRPRRHSAIAAPGGESQSPVHGPSPGDYEWLARQQRHSHRHGSACYESVNDRHYQASRLNSQKVMERGYDEFSSHSGLWRETAGGCTLPPHGRRWTSHDQPIWTSGAPTSRAAYATKPGVAPHEQQNTCWCRCRRCCIHNSLSSFLSQTSRTMFNVFCGLPVLLPAQIVTRLLLVRFSRWFG